VAIGHQGNALGPPGEVLQLGQRLLVVSAEHGCDVRGFLRHDWKVL
jgi:hypothetical protein